MLVSFTIFNKGGLILYQHSDEEEASSFSSSSNSSLSDSINAWLTDVYLNPTKSLTDRKASIDGHPTKVVVEWEETSDLIAVALYPDIRHEDFPWIRNLLLASLQDFQIFQQAQQQQENVDIVNLNQPIIDDTALFDKTFQILFKQHKNSSATVAAKHKMNTHKQTTAAKKGGAGGKEKRNWHDGKAKVTKEAMAVLDFSKSKTSTNTEEQDVDDDQVALAEARAAYLPTDADLADFDMVPTQTLVDDIDDDDENSENSWGNSLKGLFQQVTGNKVLTKQDLQVPLQEMHKLLASKNVASGVAQLICTNVESSLVGKKLSSMYRVKTAVRQALEKAINKLLSPSTQLDLLRQVVSKRDSLFGKRRPYVIVVVGINGVGKSTSLAKLAYYLKSNGCNPLLAACDTFRSGAVEQLSVHAKCLELPIFSQGYSKDPSSVAKAAIAQAEKEGNDVVLVDTAGRMQNNVPLMKALGKLAQENQPDMVVFVGEALVGMTVSIKFACSIKRFLVFRAHTKVNAILLTKFDTVSDKVGAALTMTHVTNAPILFVGTGQKYHHLKKLSTQSVIQSLFQ
jgi:signal recognition particle receptor subunit alpha